MNTFAKFTWFIWSCGAQSVQFNICKKTQSPCIVGLKTQKWFCCSFKNNLDNHKQKVLLDYDFFDLLRDPLKSVICNHSSLIFSQNTVTMSQVLKILHWLWTSSKTYLNDMRVKFLINLLTEFTWPGSFDSFETVTCKPSSLIFAKSTVNMYHRP